MSDDKQKHTERTFNFHMLTGLLIVTLIMVAATVHYAGSSGQAGARVAYLYPLSSSAARETSIPNIWIAPIDDPDNAQQLTQSRMGIFDFGVSPDGRYIAYSERDEQARLLDIYLLDLQRGSTRRLTDCASEEAECFNPVFHPDGSAVAYMRQELHDDHDHAAGHAGAPHIWLLDVSRKPYQTQPLSQDSSMIGHSPVWSADGSTLAYFSNDLSNPGILIYNFKPQTGDQRTLNFVPASHGITGTLSPDGRKLVFPDAVDRGVIVQTHLKIVDLTGDTPQFSDFTDKDGAFDDLSAQWHPAGEMVTVARQYNDERWTSGHQLYNIDVETGELIPLLIDDRYTHSFFSWNTSGTRLLMQRLALSAPQGAPDGSARPEIQVLNHETGDLTLISERAYHPRWVNP